MTTPNKISRRQALKALLAVGGGVGAASFLPAKWIQPVVKSGVLPAHAAASNLVECTDVLLSPGFNDYTLGTISEIYSYVSPTPPIGTIVNYSIINVTPTGKLAGDLSGSAATEADSFARFPGIITYSGPKEYSFTIRLEASGCYKEFFVIRSQQ